MPLQLNNDNLTVALVLKAKNLVSKGVNEAKGDIKDLGKTAKKSAKDIEAAYKNLGIRSRREIDREIRKMEASYKRLQRSGKLSADEQKRAYKALKGQIKALRDESRGASKEIKGMAGEVNALGGLLTGAAIVAGVRSIVDAGLEMERIKQSLKAAVGNDRFAEEMKFVRAEADRLGLSLRTASADYAQMAAASRGTSLEGQKTRDIFKAVTEASAVMGLSAADTSGAIRAVNQMISKGTVSAEELRGQLGERLPGAFQIAARAMKVSTEDLGKMLEQGELMADEFLPRFGRQIRQELGGQVESATKRAAASFQRMGNAWFDVKVNLAKSGLLESLAYVAEVGSEFLKNTMAAFEGLGLGIAHASESLFAFGKDQERLDRVFENQRRRIQEKYGLIKKEAEEAGTAGAVAGEKTAAGLDKATQSAEGLATELQRMGDTTAKALDPALKALGDLDKALESQHQKQAKLREKIFKTVGGAAGGYFRDQLQTIRKEAKEMLGASIAEADVSAYVEQQLNKLRQQLDRAGAWSQSSELGGIQAGSIVSELSADLDQSSTEADKLKQQMTEVAQAISKAAGNLREMLPDGEAQQVMARLDLLLEQLQAVSSEADIQANVDTLQAMMAVKRIQHELAGIPREIVTIHRIVRMGSGPVPAPPKGSRAVGGLIPDDGYYLMHKGERVVSNSYGDFNFNFPSGSMSQAEARAFVRGVVIPELQAAGR